MPRKLDTIVRLQQAVNSLQEAERQLAGVPDWMEELHEEHSAKKREIEALESEVEDSARARRKAEAATEDAEAKLEHFQGQVSRVQTQREYAALLQEIDTVKGQIRDLEDKILEEIEEQEQAQEALKEKQSAFEELDERYSDALAKWEEEKPEVADRAQILRREVEELRESLPRNLVALFDRILSHRPGDAIAPVRQTEGAGGNIYHCGACNYRVRLQVVGDIKTRGALVQCDGCKRILYVPEGEEE